MNLSNALINACIAAPNRGIQSFRILKSKKEHAEFITSDDFELELEPENYSLEKVLGSSSLYTFDAFTWTAQFVECEGDIYEFPFLYMAQHKNARKLHKVPIELLKQECEKEHYEGADVCFLYSTGRCGSTLVNAVLHLIPGVFSLQEPDAFVPAILFRDSVDFNTPLSTPLTESDQLCSELCKIGVWAQRKPILAIRPDITCFVFKFRSQCTEACDLFYHSLPRAKNTFLYRNGVKVTESIAAIFPDEEKYNEFVNSPEAEIAKKMMTFGLRYPNIPSKTARDGLAMFFVGGMDIFLEHRRRGIPFQFVFRYEEFLKDTRAVVSAFLKSVCPDIKLNDQMWDIAKQALSKDSQAGTGYSGKNMRKEPKECKYDIVEITGKAKFAIEHSNTLLKSLDDIVEGTFQLPAHD